MAAKRSIYLQKTLELMIYFYWGEFGVSSLFAFLGYRVKKALIIAVLFWNFCWWPELRGWYCIRDYFEIGNRTSYSIKANVVGYNSDIAIYMYQISNFGRIFALHSPV